MAEVRLSLDEAAGNLPSVCVCCGAEAVLSVPKKLSHWPKWTLVLLLVHPFLWVVVAMIVGRRVTFSAPFCERHKDHWHRGPILMIGSLAILLPACFLAIVAVRTVLHDEFAIDVVQFMIGMFTLMLLVVAIVVIHFTEIRPKIITKSEVVLMGVSEEFVRAMQQLDHERLERNDASAGEAVRLSSIGHVISEAIKE